MTISLAKSACVFFNERGGEFAPIDSGSEEISRVPTTA
jgi:hypothetical protein